MKSYSRLSLATITAITLLTGLGSIAFADTQQGSVSVTNQYIAPQPDLVIDSKNYKEFEKTGLHLFPGQIVEIKVDHHLNYPASGIHQSLDQLTFDKRTIYRARQAGAVGMLTVEKGTVIPFYGIWALSAMGRDHVVNAVVDKPAPADFQQLSQR